MTTAAMCVLLALATVRTADASDILVSDHLGQHPGEYSNLKLKLKAEESEQSDSHHMCINLNDLVKHTVICENRFVSLNCFKTFLKLEHFSPLSADKKLTVPEFRSNCQLPAVSYVDLFGRLNIDVENITHISVESMFQLEAKHLEGLQINSLYYGLPMWQRRKLNTPTVAPEEGYLDSLETLERFYGNNLHLGPFPDNSQLVHVELRNGILSSEWGGCMKLREVFLRQMILRHHLFLQYCEDLYFLSISELSETSVTFALAGVTQLETLVLSHNSLSYIPHYIFENKNLRYLDLSGNRLQESSPLRVMRQLEQVDLRGNPLPNPEELSETMMVLPALTRLIPPDYNKYCGRVTDVSISTESMAILQQAGQIVSFTCKVTVSDPDCDVVHVLQWHHLHHDNEYPSHETWRSAHKTVANIHMTMLNHYNGTRLVCRAVSAAIQPTDDEFPLFVGYYNNKNK